MKPHCPPFKKKIKRSPTILVNVISGKYDMDAEDRDKMPAVLFGYYRENCAIDSFMMQSTLIV